MIIGIDTNSKIAITHLCPPINNQTPELNPKSNANQAPQMISLTDLLQKSSLTIPYDAHLRHTPQK
uniref:Uncharacterized protein n=1 Tax=Rhizophora mucronata TaxID=61149 RepID=A0A2P2NSM4_RHIMU